MSAAAKPFEIVLRGGVPVVYAADEAAMRVGLTMEATNRARALLEAVVRLRNGHPGSEAMATALLVDRALELLQPAGDLRALEEWASVILGREDWLVGEVSPSGAIVPMGWLESHS